MLHRRPASRNVIYQNNYVISRLSLQGLTSDAYRILSRTADFVTQSLKLPELTSAPSGRPSSSD